MLPQRGHDLRQPGENLDMAVPVEMADGDGRIANLCHLRHQLRLDLGKADLTKKEFLEQGIPRKEMTAIIHQGWDLPRWQDRSFIRQAQVHARSEVRRTFFQDRDAFFEMRAAGNDRSARDLLASGKLEDAFIDPSTQAEIIGVDDDLRFWDVIIH